MSANEIHVGDIGTLFEVTVKDAGVVVDVSAATVREFIFRKPDRANVTKSASLSSDGTDGKLRYVTLADDLDQAGTWQLQVHVVLPTGEWHSDLMSFEVHANLKA